MFHILPSDLFWSCDVYNDGNAVSDNLLSYLKEVYPRKSTCGPSASLISQFILAESCLPFIFFFKFMFYIKDKKKKRKTTKNNDNNKKFLPHFFPCFYSNFLNSFFFFFFFFSSSEGKNEHKKIGIHRKYFKKLFEIQR